MFFFTVACSWANSGPEPSPPDPYETLYSIPFDKSSYALSDNAVLILERNARALATHPCAQFSLIGSAGSVEEPNEEKAMVLGRNRAEAVLKKLISEDISASRLTTDTWGSRLEYGKDEINQEMQRRVTFTVSSWTDKCLNETKQVKMGTDFFGLTKQARINLSDIKATSRESIDQWSWDIKGKAYSPAITNVRAPTALGYLETFNSFGFSDDKFALEFYYSPSSEHKPCDLSDVMGVAVRVRLTKPTSTQAEVFLFEHLMQEDFEKEKVKFFKPNEQTISGTIAGNLPWVMIQTPTMAQPCPEIKIVNGPYYQTGTIKGLCRHALLFARPYKINFELKCPE